jgi:ABC-type sulfate transport system permease component
MTEPHRSRPPTFQPRFTLGLLYLAGFFLLYCVLLVLPELWNVLQTQPPGPEQEQAAAEAARRAVAPRLPWALAAALLSVLLGGSRGWLPGLRGPS